jgi:hypothetical protein
VKLRIVGVYFNRKITFDDGGQPAKVTIATLLDAARTQFPVSRRGGIDYVATAGTLPSLVSFSHNFPGRYDFDGDGTITGPDDGPTLSGGIRHAGIYTLAEQGIDGGLVGWQHYVVRKGVLVSKTPASRGFQSFATQHIEDGDEVTWRLVAIALRHTTGTRDLRVSAAQTSPSQAVQQIGGAS